jgi:hypothetical protein
MSEKTSVPAIRRTTEPVRGATPARVLRYAGAYAMSNMVDGTTATIMAVAMLCVGLVSWVGAGVVAALVVVATMVLAILVWAIVAGWDRAANEHVREAERLAEEGEKARKAAGKAFDSLVSERNPAWPALYTDMRKLLADDAATGVANEMGIRLRDLNAAYEKAIKDAGRADTGTIRSEAEAAAIAIVGGAIRSHQDIDQRIRASDAVRAPDVTRRFAETARAVAGLPSVPTALPPPSASAALQRLIGIAEDALATDPDLVDSNGARIDTLVREHLPRLLERHAEAARSPSSNLTRVDAKLEEGVDEVRASIDEALAADAEARFDSLRTEVGFLRMRRGE